MNCEKVQFLMALYIADAPDFMGKHRTAFEEHMQKCQKCAKEYQESKFIIDLAKEHWQISNDTLDLIEKAGKPYESRMTVKKGWQELLRRCPDLAQRVKRRKSLQFFRRVSAVAACLVIGVLTWITFSIHSTPEIVAKSNPQQAAPAAKPSIRIELGSKKGNILIPANQQIVSTDELKTITINGKHRMMMNTNTVLAVEPLVKNSNLGCLVKLVSGQIYTLVKHDGNPFVVDTAHGEAVITGTTFDIKETDTRTTLVVSKGTVQFGSENGVVKVKAGQASSIIAQSAPTRPALCNTAKLTAWATGYKTSPILAQLTQTESYSGKPDLPQKTDKEPTVLEAESENTAAGLINKAHKHDNMYTLGPEASQQKALNLYRLALAAKPNDQQRLHILYRMAQLNGSSYQLEKGEKPNFRRAISLYKEIIDSYPPEEPLVSKAIISIGDHYTTLWEFESAVEAFKKTLDFDISEMEELLETLQANEQEKEAASLKRTIDRIKRYQEIAVDQVAYAATLIDPLRAHGELRAITEKYSGSFIADRAHKRLIENMNKIPTLWVPQNDEPFSPSGSTLQANTATTAANSERQKEIKIQPIVTPEGAKTSYSVEPNITEIPQNDKHVAGEPRAPPLSYLSKCLLGIAGLLVLGFAVIIIKKKNFFKELNK